MKAHRTDIVSFAFGLVFLALSLWWLLARILGLTLPPVGWFLAGALILIGVLGLVGALRSGRHADQAPPGTDAETTVSAPYEEATRPWVGPQGAEADEWPTDAVADIPVEATQDRPVSGTGGDPHWSPSAPPDEPAGVDTEPPTWEQPTVGGDTEAVTREQPILGDEPGRMTGRPAGEDRSTG